MLLPMPIMKSWCFQTVVLEKLFENCLDSKEIQPVHPEGNQPWIFTGRTDAEAETPALWPLDANNWLISKDPDAGKDWRWEEKGTTEDETVGWHHRLNGHECEQIWGNSGGQKEPDTLQSMGSQRVRSDSATEQHDRLAAVIYKNRLLFRTSGCIIIYLADPFLKDIYVVSRFSQSYQFTSVAQLLPTLCDPMGCSTPGFPVHHQLPELAQTRIHRVGDAIQPSHPLLSPCPPTFSLSQHQGLC